MVADNKWLPSDSDSSHLPPGEEWVKSEILKLEKELLASSKDTEEPHPSLQNRLKHLLRIPDHVYTDMLDSVRDVTRLQQRIHKLNVQRHTELEKQRERVQNEKHFYLNRLEKELEDKSGVYKWLTRKSRRITAFFKYFSELSSVAYFIRISPAVLCLLLWHCCLCFHFALALVITIVEISISFQINRHVGKGGTELFGASFGLGVAVCTLYALVGLLGWISVRYRSRTLGLVYMVSLLVVTIFYSIFASVEDYDSKASTLRVNLAEIVREFVKNPDAFPYIDSMQTRFACCGGSGVMDYLSENEDYSNGLVIQLPPSCCLRSTSRSRERSAFSACEVQQDVPFPFYLNARGCAQPVADFIAPAQAVKHLLSIALIYLYVLSVGACFAFFKTYKTEVERRELPEAKLTLGEKLLAALDVHQLDHGLGSADATVDVLRRRLAGCETIPEVIHVVMGMIEEVEDLLYVNPEFLAKMLMGIKNPELKVSGPVNMSASDTSAATASVYLEQPRLKEMTQSLLTQGVPSGSDALLRRELSQSKQAVRFDSVFILPHAGSSSVMATRGVEGQRRTKEEEQQGRVKVNKKFNATTFAGYFKNMFSKSAPPQKQRRSSVPPPEKIVPYPSKREKGRRESYQDRLERLLADVIRQSQHSVRNLRQHVKYTKSLAFASPETHQLLPHATKLLQTVASIKQNREKGGGGILEKEDDDEMREVYRADTDESEKNRKGMDGTEGGSRASSTSGAGHLGRVSGKVMTPSQVINVEGMMTKEGGGAGVGELVEELHPELTRTPGRLDVGLRNWVANMKDTDL